MFVISSVPRFAGLVLSFQLTLSVPAAAALIPVNTPFGAETATLDTTTQREWLDLSLSGNFFLNQLVTTELTTGQFQGYSLASVAEIDGFINDSGILPLTGTPAFTAFISLTDMIQGQAHDFTGDGCGLVVRGVSSTAGAFGSQELGAFSNMRGPGECMTQTPSISSNFGFDSGNFLLSPADFNVPLNSVVFPGGSPVQISGAWLFRDVAVGTVPTSGTFGLVLVGMLGLFGVARRRHQARNAADKTDKAVLALPLPQAS